MKKLKQTNFEQSIKPKWPWLILLVLMVPVVLIYFLRQPDKTLQPGGVFVIEVEKGKDIKKSLNIPKKKYPFGFPIEILNEKTFTKDGKRVITGYCRWHVDADSLLGGKVAVVPVLLFEVKPEVKKLKAIAQIISRRKDGYFALPIPAQVKDYSLGLRIELAEGCPEKFKKHVPKPKPEKKIQL